VIDITVAAARPHLVFPPIGNADRLIQSPEVEENDMRRSITIAIIIATAAITTAWSVSISGPGSANKAKFGGGGFVPTHAHLLW
jgi:hypothetical protein